MSFGFLESVAEVCRELITLHVCFAPARYGPLLRRLQMGHQEIPGTAILRIHEEGGPLLDRQPHLAEGSERGRSLTMTVTLVHSVSDSSVMNRHSSSAS
jgi:hypothetical protein